MVDVLTPQEQCMFEHKGSVPSVENKCIFKMLINQIIIFYSILFSISW